MKLQDSDLVFITGVVEESFGRFSKNTETGDPEYSFKITKNKESKVYSPYQYIQLILEAQYNATDETKNFRKKLICLANAESTIKRKIAEYNLKALGFDFSDIFEDIAHTEKRLNAYYQGSENKKAFWSGALVAFIAAIIGIFPTIVEEVRKQPPVEHIQFPKILIVHDTVPQLNKK